MKIHYRKGRKKKLIINAKEQIHKKFEKKIPKIIF